MSGANVENCIEGVVSPHPKIARKAKELNLKITNYEGFSRGGWSADFDERAPCGMWVLDTEPTIPSEEEPMTVVAENLKEALLKMEENAKYFFG